MLRRRIWLFVCLLISALPLFGHDRTVILVMIDPVANRAYIPEGTVLPAELKTIRASVTSMPLRDLNSAGPRFLEGARDRSFLLRNMPARIRTRAHTALMRELPPLVIEYAPVERFTEVRARYEKEVQARKDSGLRTNSSHTSCIDIYHTTSGTGVYGGYSSSFIETRCWSDTAPNNYGWWGVGAAAAAEDEGYVYVDDDLGNYECDDSGGGYRVRSCFVEAFTQATNFPANNLRHGGHTALIEWLNGNEPNYVWFNILIESYTYFY